MGSRTRKRKVVFIAYISNYGGIETLMIRLSSWFSSNGIQVEIIGDSDREDSEKLVDELIASGAEIKKYSFRRDSTSKVSLKKMYDDFDVTCIVFSYPALLLADSMFGNDKTANIIFYDAHQYNLMMDFYAKSAVVKVPLRIASNVITHRMHRMHEIIFMDPLCKKRTVDTFKLKHKYNDDIVYLPMKVKLFDEDKIKAKIREKKDFNILTIGRMTFPFKGYVFGLVDIFEELYEKYPFLSLTVVGTGEDEDEFEVHLKNIKEKIKRRITWIKGAPYEQLNSYIADAKLYVGMGTTVIDAVNDGVPALSIGSYTYKCKGYDFFHTDPANLGGIEGECDITPYIETVINMPDDEYMDLCRKDHKALYIYDIETVGTQILEFKNINRKCIFNPVERKIVNFAKRFL